MLVLKLIHVNYRGYWWFKLDLAHRSFQETAPWFRRSTDTELIASEVYYWAVMTSETKSIKGRVLFLAHTWVLLPRYWNVAKSTTRMPDVWPWWRYQLETFSTLLALCAGNSTVTGEFLSHRLLTRNFDIFFDLRLNIRLSKQSWGWWFETPSRRFWRHRNALDIPVTNVQYFTIFTLLYFRSPKKDIYWLT